MFVFLGFVFFSNFVIKKSSSKRTEQKVIKRFPSIIVQIDDKRLGVLKA